jgi:xylulokinase
MSVMLAAASSLSWAAELIGRGDHIGAVIEGAEAFARSADAVASAPIYLPYLSGERTPHNDAQATGLFAGLRASHGQDALIYAVLEGVAFSFADGTDVLAEAGAKPATPLFVGGGARSGFWGQLISDATGLTIDVAQGAEAGAALGAARLGMLAAEASDIKTICARPPTQRQFSPRAENAAALAPRLRRYRALYGAEKAAR